MNNKRKQAFNRIFYWCIIVLLIFEFAISLLPFDEPKTKLIYKIYNFSMWMGIVLLGMTMGLYNIEMILVAVVRLIIFGSLFMVILVTPEEKMGYFSIVLFISAFYDLLITCLAYLWVDNKDVDRFNKRFVAI